MIWVFSVDCSRNLWFFGVQIMACLPGETWLGMFGALRVKHQVRGLQLKDIETYWSRSQCIDIKFREKWVPRVMEKRFKIDGKTIRMWWKVLHVGACRCRSLIVWADAGRWGCQAKAMTNRWQHWSLYLCKYYIRWFAIAFLIPAVCITPWTMGQGIWSP